VFEELATIAPDTPTRLEPSEFLLRESLEKSLRL